MFTYLVYIANIMGVVKYIIQRKILREGQADGNNYLQGSLISNVIKLREKKNLGLKHVIKFFNRNMTQTFKESIIKVMVHKCGNFVGGPNSEHLRNFT